MAAPSTSFVKQYQATISLLAQQMDTRLKAGVMVDTNWTGEEKFYDQYGTDTMVEISSRLADTPVQAADHRRRKVSPRYYVSNTIEDPFEAMAMLIDPKSAYMQAKMASANRKIDKTIIDALGGTAYYGKTGSSSATLGSGNKVLVQSAGLTKNKLIEAKVLLDEDEVPKNDRYFACSAEQVGDLLKSTEATSSDFNVVKALVQGELDTWIGFKITQTEQLEVDASYDRLCYAWQKQGLQLAIQKNPTGNITERPDKNYAWQVYLQMALGAVRLEEIYVVQVACDEAEES